jgi:hypothetical protein
MKTRAQAVGHQILRSRVRLSSSETPAEYLLYLFGTMGLNARTHDLRRVALIRLEDKF